MYAYIVHCMNHLGKCKTTFITLIILFQAMENTATGGVQTPYIVGGSIGVVVVAVIIVVGLFIYRR